MYIIVTKTKYFYVHTIVKKDVSYVTNCVTKTKCLSYAHNCFNRTKYLLCTQLCHNKTSFICI
jgi:hypothetical protein